MKRVAAVSTATAVAHVLREEILSRQDGDLYLGQENELLARLGVSRPSLRQAVRLLQAEGILTVRRGHHGGLYGQRPDAAGVAHMASVFLRTRRASFADLSATHALITTECARLAALNPDPAERGRLLTFVDADAGGDARDHARARAQWGVLLAEIARSPTLQLFEDVLGSLSRYPTSRPFLLDPDSVALAWEQCRWIAEAVRDGDADTAAMLCREHEDAMARYLRDQPDDRLGW
ncbi:FadR family transcriptional regulator [Frankia sp. B2]|uniref:FadR/GntR family transcriptional regulator n=1 Tax=Frankia sp. B2 TaxID=2541730 RepID=UPI00106B034E|nr:FCD domain-containing protein [Frankia sp. B2]TFE30496.1 FadR family transcriptional regulator [Frankia sp. B2]